jgi:hypothetical protein
MEKINRYPGSKPFTIEYKDLFYGRENDIDDLSKYVSTEKLTILYGKSGLGKSSLLNVGIIPRFESEYQFFHISVRFGNFTEFSKKTPVELFLEKITITEISSTFIDDIENENISLWQYFKNLQLQFSDKKGFLLTCDQFEELFTYPSGLQEFITQFAELLSNRMPKQFRKTLQRKLKENPDLLNEEQIEFLEQEINLKVVISIRSDKLSLLNQLSESIPNILRNCYELKPLTNEQAIDAIIKPAKKAEDVYISQVFNYETLAIKEIINFLSKNGQQKIETFLLQLVCQYTENIVINNQLSTVSKDDLEDLQYISQNFYDNIIAQLNPEEQDPARVLIEDGLILEEEERRLSLYEGQIYKQFNISRELLQKLVDVHILRAEPYYSGGFVYEISHDTLIAPILNAKKIRKEKEEEKNQLKKKNEELRIANEKAEIERIEKEKQKKQNEKLRIFLIISLFCFVLACFFSYFAYKQYSWAEIQNKRADFARELANENATKAQKQENVTKDLLKYLINNSEIKDSNYYAFFSQRGIKNFRALKYKEALQNFQIAAICPDARSNNEIKLWQKNIGKAINLKSLGDNEFTNGKYDQANTYYKQIYKIDSAENDISSLIKQTSSLIIIQNKGKILLQANKFDEAFEVFNSLLESNPSDKIALDAINICKRKIKNYDVQRPNKIMAQNANYSTEKRLAIVVGNANYPSSPLKNPVNDAKGIAEVLKELNFEVILLTNSSQNDMKLKIREFGEKLSKYDVGLFYFSGHGMQVKGENYLIPVNAQIEKEQDVEFESVNLNRVLGELEYSGVKISVVILDAARNDPFSRSFIYSDNSFGLNYYIKESLGTIIMYATSPGSVEGDGSGKYGLFTEALIKYLKTPDITIEEVMTKVRKYVIEKSDGKQIPVSNSTLIIDFYLNKTSKK